MAYKFNPFTSKLEEYGPILTGTGTVSAAADGTAALPGIAFTNDLNTGIYRPGADQLALSTNGTGRLSIDANGNISVDTNTFYVDAVNNRIGVGTASPTELLSLSQDVVTEANLLALIGTSFADGEKIFATFKRGTTNLARVGVEVGGAGATGQLIFETASASTSTERLRITSTGLVGIGTSAPRTLFNIASTTGPSLTIENTSTTVTGTGTYGSVDWYGNDASTGASGIRAQILASSRGSSGECALDLGTSSTGTAIQTRMRIDSNGFIGIGTTSPGANLELGAVASANQSLRINSSGNNYIELSTNGSTGEHKITAGNSASGTAQLIFETSSGGVESERARIDSSGRLLVGTSTDSGGSKLQINDNRIRIATAKTPASATDTGVTGEICWDANYVYVCTATNTWKRTALATW